MNLAMDYMQQSNQGCLVVDLMYLFGIEPTREQEEKLLSEGLFKFRENYTFGIVMAFLDAHPDKQVTIYFDNIFYLRILQAKINHPRVKMVLGKNDAELLDNLDAPFIVYIDNNITDGFTHLPHFMMVTGVSEKMYDVFDPWYGKTTKVSKKKILHGIDQLRTHVKVCPFIITAG